MHSAHKHRQPSIAILVVVGDMECIFILPCSLRHAVRCVSLLLSAAAKRRMRPMTFEYGCELLRWLEEAEAFALAPLENRCY